MNSFAFSAEACRSARRAVPPPGMRMYFSFHFLCAAGKPGVAPAGVAGRVVRPTAQGLCFSICFVAQASRVSARRPTHLFFASPKKSKQKKGDPQSGSPSGQPAVLEASGVWLNSLRSNNASPDPLASALLGPARTGGGPGPDFQPHKYAPWRVLVGLGDSDVGLDVRFPGCSDFRTPRRNEEASSARADGSGLALSERSEFSQTPAALSNAAYRRSRATNPARLSFAYFSLAKQRTSESAAGPRPGLVAHSTKGRNRKGRALSGAHPDVHRLPGRHPACPRNKKAKNKTRAACARPHPSRRESQK